MNAVPLVRDVMHETTHSVPPDMDVFEALDYLVAKKLSGMPVIDDENRLVGFLTEKDCLRLQVIAHQYNMTGMTVRDIMSGINKALHPDNDILTAAMAFLGNFATLPVLNGQELVGSITRRDLLVAIQRWYRDRGLDYENGKAIIQLMQNPSSIGDLQVLVGKSSDNKVLAAVLGGRHSAQQP